MTGLYGAEAQPQGLVHAGLAPHQLSPSNYSPFFFFFFTAQEVLGLQRHSSQGPDEAAGHWRWAQS